MADQFFTRTPQPAVIPARGGRVRFIAIGILMAFVMGAGAAAALFWSGTIPLTRETQSVSPQPGRVPLAVVSRVAPPASADAPGLQAATTRQGALETRIGVLEQRLAQIDLRTEAAQGNAARSEGLLVAFAARRALDRGTPLGFLEYQLRLRFGDAQPNAVKTVIDTGSKPVTLDQLIAGLDALAPRLSATPAAQLGTWETVKRELAGLFVVRHDTTPSTAPADRLERIHLAVVAGRIEEAINEVQRLPGAADASGWIADARRYAAARNALDQIETAALLEPRSLRDAAGRKVEQVSPAIPPLTTPPSTAPAN